MRNHIPTPGNSTQSKNPFNMGRSAFLLDKKRLEGKAERTTAKVELLWTLSRPDLGARLIAPEVLRVLKVVEARGRLQTAKRLRARRFVFPSNRSRQRCMSEDTTNVALRRLGFARRK